MNPTRGRSGLGLPQVPGGGVLVPTGQNFCAEILAPYKDPHGQNWPPSWCCDTPSPLPNNQKNHLILPCPVFVVAYVFSLSRSSYFPLSVTYLHVCFLLLLTYIFPVFNCSVSNFIDFFTPLFLPISNVILVSGLFVLPCFSFFLMFLLSCLTYFFPLKPWIKVNNC